MRRWWSAVIGAVVLVVLAVPATASAAPEPEALADPLLTFVSTRYQGRPEIMVMTPQGHRVRRLTNWHAAGVDGHFSRSSPDWAPNRVRILFSSGASGTTQGGTTIEYVGPTGSDLGGIASGSQFVFDGDVVGGASWAPTGGRVAFTREHRARTGGSAGLIVQTVSTHAERSVDGVFLGDLTTVSWSPDGRRFAAVRKGTDVDTWFTFQELVVYDLVARTETPLGDAAWATPMWSSDGTSILFQRGDELRTIDPDGSNDELLTIGGGGAWSPDSSRIAFSRGGNLWTIGRDGTGEVQLTTAPQNFDPNWSGDGRTIAFTSTRDGNQEIYLMRSDGSGQRNLTHRPGNDSEPDWRPRG